MARSPWTPITSIPAIALVALGLHPSPERCLSWARGSSLRVRQPRPQLFPVWGWREHWLRFVEECGANRPAVRVLVAAAARLGREYLLVCLNAMSLGQPSIVEMSVGTVVCGTQYTAPGIGRVEAERLVQPNSQEARFGTGPPCIHGSERITNAFLNA